MEAHESDAELLRELLFLLSNLAQSPSLQVAPRGARPLLCPSTMPLAEPEQSEGGRRGEHLAEPGRPARSRRGPRPSHSAVQAWPEWSTAIVTLGGRGALYYSARVVHGNRHAPLPPIVARVVEERAHGAARTGSPPVQRVLGGWVQRTGLAVDGGRGNRRTWTGQASRRGNRPSLRRWREGE